MERLDIILQNDENDLYENKLLLEWLTANYKQINKNNYYIKLFSINYDDIDSDKIDELAKLNIVNLPVLLNNNKVCCNHFNEIKDYILNIIKSNIQKNEQKKENNEDVLQNWMLHEISAQDDGIEEPIDMKTIETKDKTLRQQNDIAYSIPKKRITSTVDTDDDLMNKYFENQQIT
jgi:hypothetical protein